MLGKRKKIIVRSIIVLIILTIIISLDIELSMDEAWICTSCGSKKTANWLFGIRTSEGKHASSLEEWMTEYEIAHEHDWRRIKGTRKGTFGTSRRHGKTPPVYSLRPECLSEYLSSASDSDIRKLIEILDSGSDEDQVIFIEQITEKWLEGLEEELK